MEPRAYLAAHLERSYCERHPGLTPAARELVREQIAKDPERYLFDDHDRALYRYGKVRERLLSGLAALDDVSSDEAFEQGRAQLVGETRVALARIAENDRLCIDAALLNILLADVSPDNSLGDLMWLEKHARAYLAGSVEGFDEAAPRFWTAEALAREGAGAAELTRSEPVLIGWLHTLEAISQVCFATGRHRAAIAHARTVMRADGYPHHAEGTIFLALARLEDEDGFFSFARSYEKRHDDRVAAEDSPWYLLSRTLLLYKLGKDKAARRALRDFAARCEGGAFFLFNPGFAAPYLPVRPEPRESWSLAQQAAGEADIVIADTPDFRPWAESFPDVVALSDDFADRNGF